MPECHEVHLEVFWRKLDVRQPHSSSPSPNQTADSISTPRLDFRTLTLGANLLVLVHDTFGLRQWIIQILLARSLAAALATAAAAAAIPALCEEIVPNTTNY